jgi:hypothetical protein
MALVHMYIGAGGFRVRVNSCFSASCTTVLPHRSLHALVFTLLLCLGRSFIVSCHLEDAARFVRCRAVDDCCCGHSRKLMTRFHVVRPNIG